MPYGPEVMRHFMRTVKEFGGRSINYDYELVGDLPVFADETNRPEIFSHHFGDITQPIQADHVIIFHKVKGDTGYWLRHFPQIIYTVNNLQDQDAFRRNLKKLLDIYLQDSSLVTEVYSSRGSCFDLREL